MSTNRKKLIPNVVLILVIVVGICWVASRFIHLGRVEYTNNAQVKQHITPINTRVQGFIKKIYFEEYQRVRKGDTLVVIEDTEYCLRLAQAEADYRNALVGMDAMHTTVHAAQSNVLVTDAGIEEVRVRLVNAEKDYERYKELLKQEAVTVQQFDQVKTEFEATKARYEQILRQRQAVSLVKQEQTQRLEQNEANIKLAEAALNLARLNLSYTVIIAPCDGITGRKNIQEGQLVQPGQTLLNVIDENDKWIVANYKETQTLHIVPDHAVDIQVDALPDVTFKGVVRSVSQATGASLSLLPQDNSAGNFVKVEQRIPVKIEFTEENDPQALRRLRAGMNVQCFVNY